METCPFITPSARGVGLKQVRLKLRSIPLLMSDLQTIETVCQQDLRK